MWPSPCGAVYFLGEPDARLEEVYAVVWAAQSAAEEARRAGAPRRWGRPTPSRRAPVVTIGPGIYLPGWGGVRLQDRLLVTRDGAELLCERSPHRTRRVG